MRVAHTHTQTNASTLPNGKQWKSSFSLSLIIHTHTHPRTAVEVRNATSNPRGCFQCRCAVTTTTSDKRIRLRCRVVRVSVYVYVLPMRVQRYTRAVEYRVYISKGLEHFCMVYLLDNSMYNVTVIVLSQSVSERVSDRNTE